MPTSTLTISVDALRPPSRIASSKKDTRHCCLAHRVQAEVKQQVDDGRMTGMVGHLNYSKESSAAARPAPPL